MAEAAQARPALSVVVPMRDEAENVRALVDEIAAALNGALSFEIVCVDDGSADGTAEALKAARLAHPRLRVLRHQRSFGQSAALLTGVRAARAEWIATLDGDGQNPPAEILRLIAARDRAASTNPALVAGYRAVRRDRWDKRLASRLANALRRRLLRDGVRDSGCGLKLFRREAFLELPAFDHMHRYLPALFARAGGAVIEVAVEHRSRRSGRSKYGIRNRLAVTLLDFIGVFWLLRRPLRPIVERGE